MAAAQTLIIIPLRAAARKQKPTFVWTRIVDREVTQRMAQMPNLSVCEQLSQDTDKKDWHKVLGFAVISCFISTVGRAK